MTPSATTGFTIADRNYFIGLVAMLTSLRRHGHDFPVVVLDLGLTPPQRDVLEREFDARAVVRSEVADWHPHLLGPFPHLFDPSGIVVYLDADLILTRPLDDLLAAAADGKLCAIVDEIVADRWFAAWEPTLALTTPLRHGRYVNLGCLAFSAEQLPDLLRRWWECCAGFVGTLQLPTSHGEPFALGDQDVLNALLMSEVPADQQQSLAPDLQPQRPGDLARTKLVDARTLACTVDGHPVAILHPVSKPKPWQAQRRQAFYGSGYERCLRETVAASAGAIAAAETPLPVWLHPGWRGTLHWRLGVWWTQVRGKLGSVKRAVRGLRR